MLMALLLFTIGALGYWEMTMSVLAVVTAGVIAALLLGLAMGIIMARFDRLEALLKPVLDFMYKTPSFVYLIVAVMFFGIGMAPATIATIIYTTPVIMRMTNYGIRNAPAGVVEAAQSFGSTRWQVLFEVQWPLAIPTVVAGINQATMFALSMVIIASLIGAGGLGQEVLQAIGTYDTGRAFAAGLTILLLVLIIDRTSYALVKRQRR